MPGRSAAWTSKRAGVSQRPLLPEHARGGPETTAHGPLPDRDYAPHSPGALGRSRAPSGRQKVVAERKAQGASQALNQRAWGCAVHRDRSSCSGTRSSGRRVTADMIGSSRDPSRAARMAPRAPSPTCAPQFGPKQNAVDLRHSAMDCLKVLDVTIGFGHTRPVRPQEIGFGHCSVVQNLGGVG